MFDSTAVARKPWHRTIFGDRAPADADPTASPNARGSSSMTDRRRPAIRSSSRAAVPPHAAARSSAARRRGRALAACGTAGAHEPHLVPEHRP